MPLRQQIGAQPDLVQRSHDWTDRPGTAGENPLGDGVLHQSRVLLFQKADHTLQTDGKAPGLLAGVLTGDHAVSQQPACLPFADAADAVALAHPDDCRVFLSKISIVHPVTSHGKAHVHTFLVLLLRRFFLRESRGDGKGGMSQPLLDLLHGDALTEQQTGAAVSKSWKGELGQAHSLQHPVEHMAHAVRGHGAAAG